jgi:hypothetical protein
MVHMIAVPKPKRRNWGFRVTVVLFLVLFLGLLGWSSWVYVQIQNYVGLDQAAPSDAIGVLGAAEYDGRPSPVFRARLDHASELYKRGIAPLIITLGGTGGDEFSEGAVGREYLMSLGVPESAASMCSPHPGHASPSEAALRKPSALRTRSSATPPGGCACICICTDAELVPSPFVLPIKNRRALQSLRAFDGKIEKSATVQISELIDSKKRCWST